MEATPHLRETVGCLCLAARRAARAITASFDRGLRAHGLRSTQFTLLAVLALKGEQTIGALATIIGADRTTMTRNVALAARRGLVTVARDEADARSRRVAITPGGRSTLEEAFVTWRTVQHTLTEAMGTAAADGLRRIAKDRLAARSGA
ncbi:MarR family winged helix-turn-helix transcriptional regulator [Elioraea rosea]|uniref:MarR family winged helix-turn-helix transcriptional regulator n=1 Tax=Elioraea rosea TaxID=2492390 RepID=UPI0011834270|nr:MarR family winged helix-turn-helix transcriptional regulator [Elioraea rosea]